MSWYGRLLRSGRRLGRRLDCSASFFWSHSGRATQADPGEKRDTAKTSITIATDSQKVLDLTTPNREDNPQRPVVCFDESPVQLIGEVRDPISAKPMQPLRYDCEYRRNGTVNLFVFLDAHQPWRRVKVTDRRTNKDFAECMRELVDIDYADAKTIRVVMDNLSTHSPGALYDAFPAAEARRVLKRLEFHHTPKHASWLNMVEIGRASCRERV